jgi:putative endonuclease
MIEGFVYILSNKNKTVLYVGATKYLKERIEQHIKGKGVDFTKKYSVNELLYFEKHANFHDAFKKEKQLKNWHKDWKWNLIKSQNPNFKNLYLDL